MSTKTGENESWLQYDETDWSYFIVLDTKLEWSFTEMFVLTLTKCHYICFVSKVIAIGQNFEQIFLVTWIKIALLVAQTMLGHSVVAPVLPTGSAEHFVFYSTW